MEIGFNIIKGKIMSNKDKIADIITSLEDGSYIMSISKVNPLLTELDYRKAYFAMIDTCVKYTGNRKYIIHESFKKDKNINSTADLTIIQWKKVLADFQWWAHDKMNIIM